MNTRLDAIAVALAKTNAGGATGDGTWQPPKALAGLSLQHLPVEMPPVAAESTRASHSGTVDARCFAAWVALLPSQYDSWIELDPHEDLSVVEVADLTESISTTGADASVTAAVATPLDRWQARLAAFNDDLTSYIFAHVGSRRYAVKTALEIRRSDARAAQFESFYPALPPAVASYLDARRALLPPAVASHFSNSVLMRHFFGWAYRTLMSRGFSFGEETWVMLPWVDYFNFAQVPNVHVVSAVRSYDAGPHISKKPGKATKHKLAGGQIDGDAAVTPTEPHLQFTPYQFKTQRAIAKGEQLLLNYGTYADVEISLWYGFALCGPSSSCASGNDGGDSDSDAVMESEDEVADGAPAPAVLPKPIVASAGAAKFTHQSECAYILSPLADANGDHPAPGDSDMEPAFTSLPAADRIWDTAAWVYDTVVAREPLLTAVAAALGPQVRASTLGWGDMGRCAISRQALTRGLAQVTARLHDLLQHYQWKTAAAKSTAHPDASSPFAPLLVDGIDPLIHAIPATWPVTADTVAAVMSAFHTPPTDAAAAVEPAVVVQAIGQYARTRASVLRLLLRSELRSVWRADVAAFVAKCEAAGAVDPAVRAVVAPLISSEIPVLRVRTPTTEIAGPVGALMRTVRDDTTDLLMEVAATSDAVLEGMLVRRLRRG
jgi:hypothetical protein